MSELLQEQPETARGTSGATWADCVGCGRTADEVRKGTNERVAPFLLSVADLAKLNVPGKDDENKAYLMEMGGGVGLCEKLLSNRTTGIRQDPEEIGKRIEAFGENRFPEPPFDSWFSLFFECFQDEILIVLLIAAIVSLIIETIEHPQYGWMDGVAIFIAVVIVASVTATNDYNKQLQFRALHNESKNRIEVQVVRDGKRVSVPVADVVVGDIVHLETGNKIPADGIVLMCNDFKANESALTGESDDITKDPDNAPILLSGAQVAAGTCDYIVTAVGVRSMQGAIMQDTAQEDGDTPLQAKLDTLASKIGYVGVAAAIGTFVAMMIIKAVGGEKDQTWAEWTVHSFIYGVTIIVVAIPEGLPLAVTISLAYSTRKMLADQNLIRHLAACETMGGATDICSDKTGTLTENRMTVTQAWLGGHRVSFAATEPVDTPETSTNWKVMPAALREMLRDHVSLNSTAVVMVNDKGKREVKGSKTEGAGILLVESCGFDPETIRKTAALGSRVLKQYSFSSERKMMSTLVLLPDGRVRMYTTGGSDFVLARSSHILRVPTQGGAASHAELVPVDQETTSYIVNDVIVSMAKQSLRTLGFAYRDFPSVDALPADYDVSAPEGELTLYSILGIKDPLRKEVSEAVEMCRKAGVTVRMVTGDNKITATAIAKECGILQDGGLVMEGPDFRSLTPSQLDEIIPRLVVLARSSPRDKNILVRRLNGNLPTTREEWEEEHPDCDFETEHTLLLPGYFDEWAAARKHPSGTIFKAVVGVTGDGTNDAPALKAADVGLAMGISGTQVAMDAADIVILDDRFYSIVRAILWGRSVYDNVQAFLQFQLTVNVVALAITFLSAVMQQEPPLNPIMMLWVNLIMDTLGALALGTEAPRNELLDRKPYGATASLILPRMWRHVLIQAAFQLTLLLTLVVLAEDRFGITIDFLNGNKKYFQSGSRAADANDIVVYKSTFIFNAFVFCQIFNEFNARSLTDRWNVFEGITKNHLFLAIIVVSMGMQALIVEVGGAFCKTSGLTAAHWGYTILMGAISIPLGYFMRQIPVPERLSDYAQYYQKYFYDAMNVRYASSVEAGRAPIFLSSRTIIPPAPIHVPKDTPGVPFPPTLAIAGSLGTGTGLGTAQSTAHPSAISPMVGTGLMSPADELSLVPNLHSGYTPAIHHPHRATSPNGFTDATTVGGGGGGGMAAMEMETTNPVSMR